jgi:hypothetical protein
MHILVAANPADDLQRVWDYCCQYNITMYYGRIDHEYHDIAWQIVDKSSARLDLLLLLFPHSLSVVG